MKVTGFQIREAMRRWELRRETAANQFTDSLLAFRDEQKATPDEVMKGFVDAEAAVAKLQTAQAKLNLVVTVDVQGTKMPLIEAIKRLGGAGRAEKMWRQAAGGTKKDRYGYRDENVRREGEERAASTISQKEAISRATKAGSFASAVRNAIAKGNTVEVEIENLDPALVTE